MASLLVRRVLHGNPTRKTFLSQTTRNMLSNSTPIRVTLFPGEGIGPEITSSVKEKPQNDRGEYIFGEDYITQRSMRVAECAFQYAKTHGLERISSLHAANIEKMVDDIFLECCRNVAKAYPEIKYTEVDTDKYRNMLVQDPAYFDVLVMPNYHGFLMNSFIDKCLGRFKLSPSYNIGKGDIALAETKHGATPDIARKGIHHSFGFATGLYRPPGGRPVLFHQGIRCLFGFATGLYRPLGAGDGIGGRPKLFHQGLRRSFGFTGLYRSLHVGVGVGVDVDVRRALFQQVTKLKAQIDDFGVEIEGLPVTKGKPKLPRLTYLVASMVRHKSHLMKLLWILRLLDYGKLNPQKINTLEAYVEHNQVEFQKVCDVEKLYNSLALDEDSELELQYRTYPPSIQKGTFRPWEAIRFHGLKAFFDAGRGGYAVFVTRGPMLEGWLILGQPGSTNSGEAKFEAGKMAMRHIEKVIKPGEDVDLFGDYETLTHIWHGKSRMTNISLGGKATYKTIFTIRKDLEKKAIFLTFIIWIDQTTAWQMHFQRLQRDTRRKKYTLGMKSTKNGKN